VSGTSTGDCLEDSPASRASQRPSHIHLQRGDEGLLRDVDLAELAHALLAFLLLLQKLALAGDVAAVALGGDVFSERAHGLASDDLAADRGLDRHLEHVRRNELFQLLRHGAAATRH
jgi:hypothetical protein